MIQTQNFNGRFQDLKTQYGPKQCTSGAPNFRTVQCALDVVLRCQNDSSRRNTALKVAIQFIRTNNPAVCSDLAPESLAMFKDLREWVKYFKFGHIQLTNEVKSYHHYDDSNIMDSLIQIQAQIDYHNIIQSYKKALMDIKEKFSWTQQFVNQWVRQSVYMKENQIELFKKKSQLKSTSQPSKRPAKRTAPSSSKGQVQTQTGQAPIKKVKKDTINYTALVKSIQRILQITQGQQHEIIEQRLNDFKKTEDLQFLQLLGQKTAKRIFQMRSFMKLFLDAFNEATEKPEFVAFADKDILEKIFGWQGEVNPDNVFQSYKTILESKRQSFGWSKEMIYGILRRMVEFKRIEIEFLLKR